MDSSEIPEIDPLVDSSLDDPPPRPVPRALLGRIRERLAIVALIDQARRRFRLGLATGILILVIVLSGGSLVAFFADLRGALARSIPGGMGYYDYLTSQILISLPRVLAALAGLTVLTVAVSMLSARRHARKSTNKFDDTLPV
jgi:hypothetical protein